MKKDLPAVQKAYDLAKEILPRVAKFPKEHKFILGDRVAQNSLAVLELLIRASYSKEKSRLLEGADLHLEQLRFLLRLSSDLGPLSFRGYEHVMKMVDDLGRQIGGWRKQAMSRDAQDV